MAYISFDNLNTVAPQNTQSSSQVGFFTLKDDGDEAIVRFMHDDTASFEILGTHQIKVNGKFRRINCIRNPQDPIGACPFCEGGEKLDYRFYIHLLQYTNNQDGTVNVEPKVWERSISYANKMREYIMNYGPMSDVICKIVRHGRAGDMKTEFEIIPNLNKQIYRDDIFVKKPELFEGYKALGRVVLDRNADDIKVYLNTGNFPMKEQTSQPEEKKVEQKPVWDNPQPARTVQNPVWGQQTTNNAWSVNSGATVQRPTRY